MVAFHEQLLERARPVWDAMLAHPFLATVADGSIPDERFGNWLRQDYLFAQEAVPFLALLLARAPLAHRSRLVQAMGALEAELELFGRMAGERGISLAGLEPSPTCHAYVQFLHATAYGRPYPEAFTVLYGAERAYLDSWSRVRAMQRAPGRWQAFIDNWTSDPFRGYVEWLGTAVDGLAAGAPAAGREAMTALFVTTARYEVRFWDMAAGDERWPG